MDADDLVRAIRAALDETERLAIDAKRGDGIWQYRDMRERDPDVYPWTVYAPDVRMTAGTGFAPAEALHIAHNDPAAVLRRVTADREIVAEHHPSHDPCDAHDATLRTVACDTLWALARGLGINPEEETP